MKKHKTIIYFGILTVVAAAIAVYAGYSTYLNYRFRRTNNDLNHNLTSVKSDFAALKNQNQYKINKKLEADMKKIEQTYDKTVKAYEYLLDLKTISKKTGDYDILFSDILALLSKRNYASAEAKLLALTKQITDEKKKIATAFQPPVNIPVNNSPPSSGYNRQLVKSDVGDFMVDIVSADLNNTRVIVDTASDSDCRNDCPVLSLADYISRNGAFAGINGSYFCPADYPSCSDKKNSFDTLVMNKNKKYINSDNNVYSTVPAVIFSGNSARFVTQSLQWGRDTGVDAVIAMQPLLVLNGNIVFSGDGEPKRGSKGNRSFVGATGNIVYIGVVSNATVAEAAHVIKTLGIQNALNLDNGGSTALWSGGYRFGPGRNLPNAILFTSK